MITLILSFALMGNFLGVYPGTLGHDPSVALVRDGRLVCAVEEERFTRIKHAPGVFPANALAWVLGNSRLKPSDIDLVGVPYKVSEFRRLALYSTPILYHYIKNHLDFGKFLRVLLDAITNDDRKRIPPFMEAGFGEVPIVFLEHHLAHAASVFYTSGRQSATILTVDGRGEVDSTVLWKFRNDEFEALYRRDLSQSLGFFYEAATSYLGFPRPLEDVGKTMGFAPYGKRDTYLDEKVANILKVDEDGYEFAGLSKSSIVWTHTVPYLNALERLFGPKFTSKPNIGDRRATDLAFAFQRALEQAMLALARRARSETHDSELHLSGGVALNAKANMLIRESGLFESIYIFPAASDAGVAVGAAFLAARYKGDVIFNERLEHAYLGPKFERNEIKASIERRGLKYTVIADAPAEICNLLEQQKLVCLFQGEAELGPRALGHRSILADPRNAEMWEKVNRIKGREPWRPLAPSVPYERAERYYVRGGEAPFMIMMFAAKEETARLAPAVAHIDGTARIQTVKREASPTYHQVLTEFGERTGVPIIMNTSFNLAGEPLVNSPDEALRSFSSSGLDAIVMEDFLVMKES